MIQHPSTYRMVLLTLLALLLVSFGSYVQQFGITSIYAQHHYFFNYQDMGFVKRGFLGSFLRLFPGFNSDYINFVSWVSLSTLAILFSKYYLSSVKKLSNNNFLLLSGLVFLSPALFLHSGFIFGLFDQYGMIVLVLSLMLLKHKNFFLVSLLSCVGILIHEGFVFLFYPLIMAIFLSKKSEINIKNIFYICFLPFVTLLMIALFGKYDGTLNEIVLYFEGLQSIGIITPSFYGIAPCPLGTLTLPLKGNILHTLETLFTLKNLIYFTSMSVVFANFYIVYKNIHKDNNLNKDLIYYAPLAPLALMLLGTDNFRWISVVMVLMLFVIIYRVSEVNESGNEFVLKNNKPLKLAIFSFILGPIGSMASFPMIKEIIKSYQPLNMYLRDVLNSPLYPPSYCPMLDHQSQLLYQDLATWVV